MPITLKKRGAVYYARGTVAGFLIRESTGCRTRPQADAWAIRREKEILDRHAYGAAATLTFGEAAHAYLQAGGEGRYLARILEHLGPRQLVAPIDNTMVLKWAGDLYPDAAPATINRQVIGPISAVVNMAAENGMTQPRKFRRLKSTGRRTRWLDPAEMDRLLDNAAAHLVPVLACLIGSGCRLSEALGADRTNWHPDTGELWLPETKNGHPRMVQMPARARDMMAAGVALEGRLFRTPKGQPYVMREHCGGQVQTAFNNARTAAKLGSDVTPHVLRHTWATWYYAQTKDFGRMLDLGGWRTTVTAERYRKIAPANLGDRLAKHGWDFTSLGDSLPAMPRPGGLRVVS
jgi:integrase